MEIPIIKEKTQCLVSVIIPSRNNIDSLKNTLNTLISISDTSNINYEIIIKIDNDDLSSLEQIHEICKEKDNIYVIFSSRKKGYPSLINFLEDMTYLAHGKYILALADDAEMLTPNWNNILEEELKDFKFYFPKTIFLNEIKTSNYCWVIFPKEIINILGELGPHSLIDSWFLEIGNRMYHPAWGEDLVRILSNIQIGIYVDPSGEHRVDVYKTYLYHMNSSEFFHSCNLIKEHLEYLRWEKTHKHNIINEYKNNLDS
jgi:hypothetical protein